MSDDKKDLPVVTTCFTLKELEEIKQYRENGLPEITEVTDEKLMSAFNMVLDGMRFSEIAQTLCLKKVTVMHLAERYDWHSRRLEYLDDFEREMKERILEEKIRSQGFILKALLVSRRRIGKKFDRYLQMGSDDVTNPLDMEEMAMYLKMIKAVSDLDVNGFSKDPKGNSLVGLNPGDSGITITKLSDNSIEVTPRSKSTSEMLADLAKNKREQKKDPENK